MDASRREQVRMLMRLLDSVAEEVRRVTLQEEDNFSNRPESFKETEAAQISEAAVKSLIDAISAIEHAIALMQLAIGDEDIADAGAP